MGPAGPGLIIQDEGVALPVEPILNFIGSSVAATDDPGNTRTDVTITAYNRIQEEGVDLPQEPILNFIGPFVTAVDDPGNTRTNVTINGSELYEWAAQDTNNTTADRFLLSQSSQSAAAAVEATSTRLAHRAGVIRTLDLGFATAALAAANVTFTLRVNGVDAHSHTVLAGTQFDSVSGIAVVIARGDRLTVRIACSVADATTSRVRYSAGFFDQ